ncbi:hypothetical protein [Halosolutus halophilus]|uniref:hypothetical protein n=1 Tax=Halosolutus halophilus TaxID=1552990 RepID=UPI00223525E6|nr:hypothetical protein [Halosolutus halophilus]
MDPGDRPTPPDVLDDDLRAFLEALEDEDVDTIRCVAEYVDGLASWAETRAEHDEGRATAGTASTAVDADSIDPVDGDGPTDGDGSGGVPTSEAIPVPEDVPIPEDVPDTASVSVEEIAGTKYYYYQWREGDEIRSKTVTR